MLMCVGITVVDIVVGTDIAKTVGSSVGCTLGIVVGYGVSAVGSRVDMFGQSIPLDGSQMNIQVPFLFVLN